MTKIPNFGFSAFLRLLLENETPQKRLVRERYKPSGGGYDFHRSLRLRVQLIANREKTLDEVLQTLPEIRRLPERQSVKNALMQFAIWREVHQGAMEAAVRSSYTSPNGLFEVNFSSDLVMEIGHRLTAVHVWNTKRDLSKNIATAALTLIAWSWPSDSSRPDDFAVLCLRTRTLYKWSDRTASTDILAASLVKQVERHCEMARTELNLPGTDDRPTPLIHP
jgi:hypothetical protein